MDLYAKIEELLKGLFAVKQQQDHFMPAQTPAPVAGPTAGGLQSAIQNLRSATKVTQAMNTMRAANPGMAGTVKPLPPPTGAAPSAPIKAPHVNANQKVAGGAPPASKKDPAKVAEQMKNPRPKAPKMEVLKTDENGQWSISEAD